jgi:aminoglycoside phosphotransferase family enzyme
MKLTINNPAFEISGRHRMPANKRSWQQLEATVEFLKRATSYPDATRVVETVETHMSWVFLTRRHAYKLKKPVKLSFLDYSTLSARRRCIETEFSINQRLAPGVYLDVLPLQRDANGTLNLQGEGMVVEWLLKMKRLPSTAMLHKVVCHSDYTPGQLLPAARKLARFYREAERVRLTGDAYLHHLAARVEENRKVLTDPSYRLARRQAERIHQIQNSFLQQQAALVAARATQGKIIDGHGDLRPEHVCLTRPPVIIDRLEIDSLCRAADPLDELALLAMELELLGQADAGDVFIGIYHKTSKDPCPPPLLAFYKSLRACTRARYAAWHLDDPRVSNTAVWRHKARAYLDLACRVLPTS